MPNLEEMTIEALKEIKEAWVNAWCAAVQSHAIRDTEYAAILADNHVENQYVRRRIDY